MIGCPSAGCPFGHTWLAKVSAWNSSNSTLLLYVRRSSISISYPSSASIGKISGSRLIYPLPPNWKNACLPSHLPNLTAGKYLAPGISNLNLSTSFFRVPNSKPSIFTLTSSLIINFACIY